MVATLSEAIPTVVRVSWSTEAETTGYVAFGPDASLPLATPPTPLGTEHEVLLLGNPGDSDVHYRVFSGEDGTSLSDPAVVRTGEVPRDLPTLARTGDDDPYGGVLAVPILGTTYAATFLDTNGNVVWWHAEDRGYVAQRVRLARDGASVLYNAVWLSDLSGKGEIVRVSLDGTEVSSVSAPFNTHDFVELPDGTVCVIFTDIRKDGEKPVYGDALMEIAQDGTQRVVWSAFDTYDPDENPPLNDADATWTHFNALHYLPDDDTYVLSIRNFDSIVKLTRQGEIVWTLGGWNNSFTPTEGTVPTVGQHGFQVLDDGILVFDNGSADTASSRIVDFALDLDAATYTQRWEHHHEEPLYVWAMGDVELRPDGGPRITWSTSGVMEQLHPDGSPNWELSGDFGVIFGYSSWLPSMYAEESAPW